MWIAIGVGIPFVVVAIAVAVWPGLFHSNRDYHQRERARAQRQGRTLHQSRARADCALCAAQFDAPTDLEAVVAKNAHVLRSHAQSGPDAVPWEMVTETAATAV